MTVLQGSVRHQGGALPQPHKAQRRLGRMHYCATTPAVHLQSMAHDVHCRSLLILPK